MNLQACPREISSSGDQGSWVAPSQQAGPKRLPILSWGFAGSFKGFLKGLSKRSIVGFYNIGALMINNYLHYFSGFLIITIELLRPL